MPPNKKINFAVIIPLANEAGTFKLLIEKLHSQLDILQSGAVYLVVDDVSKDATLDLCLKTSATDQRFKTIYAPENRNVVDAYLRGYKEALNSGHEFIIEMDAGLSHDPATIPLFLDYYQKGYNCVYGSRFIVGGKMQESNFKRIFLSKAGTVLANILLGSRLKDMTSGYQGFDRNTVAAFLDYKLLSKAHFYQTELRYLLRNKKQIEIPITYRAPSASVSSKAIKNSLSVLFYYFSKRIISKAPKI